MRFVLSIDSVGRFEVTFLFFLWTNVKYQQEDQISLLLLSDTMQLQWAIDNVPYHIKAPCCKNYRDIQWDHGTPFKNSMDMLWNHEMGRRNLAHNKTKYNWASIWCLTVAAQKEPWKSWFWRERIAWFFIGWDKQHLIFSIKTILQSGWSGTGWNYVEIESSSFVMGILSLKFCPILRHSDDRFFKKLSIYIEL